jgi:POT family proton-dependent oligopeptide transporter
MSTILPGVKSQKTVLGHPAGLFLLFFTEMWERFSYYGMASILVLYMAGDAQHPESSLIMRAQTGAVHVLGFASLQHAIEAVYGPFNIQALSSEIFGLYTAFVYLTPLFGGMLADRVLGQRRSVIIGGVLMAIGEFLLTSEAMFLPGLVVLILGNGFFKPNISTQVGGLYPEGDPRMDRAYTIFYAGINVGAFFSPLICGTLGQKYGWHYGFLAAGVGMTLGLMLYLWGQRFLAPDQLARAKETQTEKAPITGPQRKAIAGFMVLCIFIIVFWAVYAQRRRPPGIRL